MNINASAVAVLVGMGVVLFAGNARGFDGFYHTTCAESTDKANMRGVPSPSL